MRMGNRRVRRFRLVPVECAARRIFADAIEIFLTICRVDLRSRLGYSSEVLMYQ
jgi:hypothetical protein